jgi:hypothetical protein
MARAQSAEAPASSSMSNFERMEQESAVWSVREAPRNSGWSLSVDNDLFSPDEHDRDYTGGLAFTFSGPAAARYWLSLDHALHWIDGNYTARHLETDGTAIYYSAQFGILSFTPQAIEEPDPIADDRPYASLVYVTNSRQYVAQDGHSVFQTGLTVGMLGLPLTAGIHNAIHDAVGSSRPQGYDHQISAGGEPTARYVMSQSKLRQQRIALGSGLLETKTTAEVSVGYLTEASYGISTRIGAIDTDWWTFNPERVDYIAQPSAIPSTHGSREFYFWAGAKLRLRGYNALLQGQFRDSDHTIGASDLEPIIGEAWVGLTGQLSNGTQLSYAVRYQSAEIRDGSGHRDPVWAGVTFTHSFR